MAGIPTRYPPGARTDELIRSQVRDTWGAYGPNQGASPGPEEYYRRGRILLRGAGQYPAAPRCQPRAA